MRRILLILAPSRVSASCVDEAIDEARRREAELVALFVLDTAVSEDIQARLQDTGFLGEIPSGQFMEAMRREQERQGLLSNPEEEGFEVEVVLADGTIYPHSGRITFADASLSEETGTFLIRAEVANPDHDLRPGQFVRARLKGAIRPNAILVPMRAVQQGAKGSFVWAVDKEGKAEFRPVAVGAWHEDQWFVDQGLKDGDTVVVDGALKLRAGVPVKIVEPDQEPAAPAQQAQNGEPAEQ